MRKLFVVVVILGLSLAGTKSYAYPSGISGRTLKSSTSGCATCHGSGPSSSVTVTITGPDSLVVNQTAAFTVTVTGANGANGGVDIAARNGTLAAISAILKTLNGELTHRSRAASPWNYQFNYTAPSSAGTDTLYATGKDNVFAEWNWAPNHPIRILNATSVEPPAEVPLSFALLQNYPNPFNPSTTIEYTLPKAGKARLVVYNILGNEIATIVDGLQSAGRHSVQFSGASFPSGVYLYRLETAGFIATRKLMLLK